MTANNWAVCPRCKKKADNEFSAMQGKAATAYGELPEKEYLELIADVNRGQPELESTLREDYEIGIFSGVFDVVYNASCTECDFKYEFKTETDLNK